MKTRKIAVRKPAHDHPGYTGKHRTWTEITMDAGELMVLLGMPEGTRLISIGSNAIHGVRITVEEPPEV